jgi:hypothetical protein
MTAAAATNPSESIVNSGASPPDGWKALRADDNLQFAPVDIPEIPPRKPSWFERFLEDLAEFFADVFGPVGQAFGASWWWVQWVLLGIAVVFAAVLLVRLYGPGFGRKGKRKTAGLPAAEEWRPDSAASVALLEDADRLAAEGRFDDATHLLLQRSVAQIAAARPGWVEPSSTARELAALPALPEAARGAFGVIAARVERSLFALTTLDRADWEAARAAYAQFALARLDQTVTGG